MKNEIYFTVIVYVDDEKGLTKSIESICSVSKETERVIKLIVADPICSMETIQICKKYSEILDVDFVHLKVLDMKMAEAYNAAITQISGKYVNFMCSSMYFSTATLETVRLFAEKEGRPKTITILPWTINEKNERVQYIMSPKKNGAINVEHFKLEETPQKINLMLHSFFFRCYLINSKTRHMWFNEKIEDDCCIEFVLRYIKEFPHYYHINNQTLFYGNQLEDNFSAYKCQREEWWYLESMDKWMIPMMRSMVEEQGGIPKYIKVAILYLIYSKYRANTNFADKKVLDDNQRNTLYRKTGELLQFIDNRIIFDKNVFEGLTIPRRLRIWFIEQKAKQAGKICESIVGGNKLYLWMHSENLVKNEGMVVDSINQKMTLLVEEKKEYIPKLLDIDESDTLIPLCDLRKEHVIIEAINYVNNHLEIDGILSLGNFLPDDKLKLYVIKDGTIIDTQRINVYGYNKIFGQVYEKKYMFHTKIFVYTLFDEKSEIKFAIEVNGQLLEIEIRSKKPYAHLKNGIKFQYWNFADNWCLSYKGKNSLILERLNEIQLRKREERYQNQLETLAVAGNKFANQALDIRKKYFNFEKNEKSIWVTFDKLYKAGDNGEYIFHYVDENADDVIIYYLINADAPDYERLKDNLNVLVWGENDTLAKILHADVVLTTHGDIAQYIGMNSDIAPYLCDLLNSVNVCIQHGLTVQDIAKFQNRLFTNLHLYMCASINEIKNLSREVFGYSKEQLKLVGLARYDGLQSCDRRQILLTPSWRRNVTNTNIVHERNLYNNDFKKSEYFQIYNKLINDEKLISAAKRYKYKILYLIHPALSAQIDDFEKKEFVEIVAATSDMSYEKVLTESSIMVTDYSGVQFDFAYMRKPILYYHPAELPPHYDESEAYIYSRDAFGPLISNHSELVNQLCEYMAINCVMKDEYVDRANRFFAFSDNNNCSRIYKTICEYMQKAY